MALSGFKHGLFSRLLTVCLSAAIVCAVVATIMFHAYRDAITENRLNAELSSQAMALAPIVARRLARNDLQSTTFVLRAFSGLNYVTCVDLMRDGLRLASWPLLGCDALDVIGVDKFVDVPLGNGPSLTFKVRVDEAHLHAPVWRETIIFVGCSMIMALIIFLALTFGFRRLVLAPLDGLKTAMLTSTPRNPMRAKLYQNDEIGDIVKAYNSLVAAARLFVRRLDKSQKRLADSEKRFREFAEVSGDWFFEMDSDLKLTFVSESFYTITGLAPEDVIGKQRDEIAVSSISKGELAAHLADLKAHREFRRFEYEVTIPDRQPVHVSISGVPVLDDEGTFIGYRGIGVDVRDIKENERQLAEINRNFGDSVSYASHIQRRLLATNDMLSQHLGTAYAIWQPKDLVGGDFYWVKRIGDDDYLMFFDCTGHGVPGAFMTLIVTSVLDQIAVSDSTGLPTARFMTLIHDGVCQQLGITAGMRGHDGLDCAVVRIDRNQDRLEFSGASIDLFSVTPDGGVSRHRGSRKTLGYSLDQGVEEIGSTLIPMGDSAFLITTDGLLTQVGEATRRVMGTRRFEAGLREAGTHEPARLIRGAARVLKAWQGREERRDDVAVVAFKPNETVQD
jgi:PAS domain S-box-containing protein